MTSLRQILNHHFDRYPCMQVQDLYKLLFQAALGSEHAIQDEGAALKWLEDEIAAMGTSPDEPLSDPLSPDGRLVRINLRPYIQAGGEPKSLLAAFLRTANEWHASLGRLQAYGKAAARLAGNANWVIKQAEIETFFATMEGEHFPARHHSENYRQLYRPAYRVIDSTYLEAA